MKRITLAILIFCAAPLCAASYDSAFYQDFITAAWYEKHGQPAAALEYYQKLNAAHPGDAAVLKSLTAVAIVTENKAAMEEYIPAYLKAAPKEASAIAANAALLWSRGDLNGALAQYQKAIKIAPDSPEIVFKYITLLAGVDSDKAIACLKNLAKEYPNMAGMITLQIADLYLKANDAKSAINYLQTAAKQHPDLVEPRLGLIRIYESSGQTAAALAQYLELEKAGFVDADILTKIGAYYVLQNQKDLSKQYFLNAKDLDNANPLAAQFLAINAQEAKAWADAIKYLTESRDYDKTPSYHVRVSYFYNRLGDTQKAAEVLQNAYNKFDKNAEVGIYYALSLIDEQDYKTAVKILREALVKAPNNEAALFHLSYALERQKNYKEMQKYLYQLLKINPKHAAGLNFLGYYLVDKTKEIEEGGGYIKRAIAITPNDYAVIDSLAWYHYKKGDYKQALDLLLGVLPEAGKDTELLLHLGMTYEQLGDYANAQTYYQQLLELEPKNREAKKGLKRVKKKI